MELGGPLADEQFIGDLCILPTTGEECQHFEFPGCQVRLCAFVASLHMFQQSGHHYRLQKRAAGVDGTNSVEDLLS